VGWTYGIVSGLGKWDVEANKPYALREVALKTLGSLVLNGLRDVGCVGVGGVRHID
jgi:hypothetical protein